ncbi:MAG: histidine kinase [Reichenbachiella sp.]|uniref:sensor histidine kinase n=1 Tax=Reichenbachiella sp. TaxID=2184521 RepID=UPI00329A3174
MSFNLALILAIATTIKLFAIYSANILWVYPKFNQQFNKYIFISILVVLTFTLVYLVIEVNFLPSPERLRGRPPRMGFHFIRIFLIDIFAYMSGTFYMMYKQKRKLEEREKQLTQEKLETELKLLKAQIDPHFIFNALNNIYSLSYMNAKSTPESILKLSEMLRYVFYDCSMDKVPLSSEVKYIENFTAFQKMKSEHDQNISFKGIANLDDVELAPMLLVPLIENAFKYSRVEEDQKAFVEIIIAKTDAGLHFSVVNSIPKNSAQSGSGMGVKNVKHRLEIIYPDRFSLTNTIKDDVYCVDLIIDL